MRSVRLLALGVMLLSTTAIIGDATAAGRPGHGTAAAAPAHGPRPRFVLPKPRVGKNRSYSPNAIVAALTKKKFKVQQLFRKGSAYSVVAIGPSGNKVQLTVDGASGTILGLAVMQWAPKVARPPHKAAPPRSFAGDTRPFGAVVPAPAYRKWTSYRPDEWVRPGPAVIPIVTTYAPYQEALPYNYYVTLPDRGFVPVVPPNYEPYAVVDPMTGVALDALDQRDAAENAAALAEARANYEAARADLAEADANALAGENAALRDELDALQTPPENFDVSGDGTAAGAGDDGALDIDAGSGVPPEDAAAVGESGSGVPPEDAAAVSGDDAGSGVPPEDAAAVGEDGSGVPPEDAAAVSGDDGGADDNGAADSGDNGGDDNSAADSGDDGGTNSSDDGDGGTNSSDGGGGDDDGQ